MRSDLLAGQSIVILSLSLSLWIMIGVAKHYGRRSYQRSGCTERYFIAVQVVRVV